MKRILLCLTACSSLVTALTCARGAEPADPARLPRLLETYQTLHAHPELSHAEEQTAGTLAAALRKAGYQVTERGGCIPTAAGHSGCSACCATDLAPRC